MNKFKYGIRTFDPETSFNEIVDQLNKDQQKGIETLSFSFQIGVGGLALQKTSYE